MSHFPPIRVNLHMDSGILCYGHLFKQVLTIPVEGVFVQIWVHFEDSAFEDRCIRDSSIISLDVEHRPREVGELSVSSSL